MERVFLIALLLIAAGGLASWHYRRSRRILDQWAADHGYRILAARYCWLWRGPFSFRSTENQSVYEVTVADQDGRRRKGWVRCGGFWFGVFSDDASVRWKDRGA